MQKADLPRYDINVVYCESQWLELRLERLCGTTGIRLPRQPYVYHSKGMHLVLGRCLGRLSSTKPLGNAGPIDDVDCDKLAESHPQGI